MEPNLHPRPDAAGPVEFNSIRQRLVEHQYVSDDEFDALLPPPLRAKSEVHWTPTAVAQRAAQMLVKDERSRILDVGSGAGKFCLVAALSTPGTFVGVEQRHHLTDFARAFAHHHQIDRVSFINAKIEHVDWSSFTGFYLYNPFVETLYEPSPFPPTYDQILNERWGDDYLVAWEKIL